MAYASKHFENLLEQLSALPSIGRKTAARLAFHLVQKDKRQVKRLAQALIDVKEKVFECAQCANLSDDTFCEICSDNARDRSVICVVETARDVMAIENTSGYKGLYHVLGGLISPLDDVHPENLHIDLLLQRLADDAIREVIFALSPNMKGDTTIFYIRKKMPFRAVPLVITALSRGVAFGGNLEHADEMTLAQAMEKRVPMENYVQP